MTVKVSRIASDRSEREQETRLDQFAKALAVGNRKQAIRVARKVLTDEKLRVLEGKRHTWIFWHWQLTHPDPQHSDRELLNMLLGNRSNAKAWEDILKTYDSDVQRYAEPYYKALLSGRLIRRVLQLRSPPSARARQRGKQS